MGNYGNICFEPTSLKYSGPQPCLDAHPRAPRCSGAARCRAERSRYSTTVLIPGNVRAPAQGPAAAPMQVTPPSRLARRLLWENANVTFVYLLWADASNKKAQITPGGRKDKGNSAE